MTSQDYEALAGRLREARGSAKPGSLWRRVSDTDLRKAIEAAQECVRLREALEPFAKVAPSSLYAKDGSDGETYCAILRDKFTGNRADFSGADLARAREVYALSSGTGDREEGGEP